MNILVIGGSNSVMKPGYLDRMAAALNKTGHVVGTLGNLSVGGNNCLIGLENLKSAATPGAYDKIVVEFAINDMSLATPRGFETWQCAYEGLLRHILRTHPRAQVYHLLLGRMAAESRARTERIRVGMREIVGHYSRCRDVRLLDFDRALRKILGDDQARIEAQYQDGVHYGQKNGAPMLGRYVARHLAAPPVRVAGAWPAPLHAQAFDRAELHRLAEGPADTEVREFRNTRFARDGRVMKAGEALTVELPGPLISLSFLATVDSRPLLVEEEGEAPVLLYTAHSELVKTPDKFRIKNFTFGWKQWAAMPHKGPRTVTLTAIERSDLPRFERFLVKGYNMVPGSGEGSGPYLGNLLHLPPAEPAPLPAPAGARGPASVD